MTGPDLFSDGAPSPLSIVTGAPGAGKTTVVQTLLARHPDFLVFDADWLLDAASSLSGQRVAEMSQLWPPYRILWLTILQMIAHNRCPAVLFIPLEPSELPVSWQGMIRWCLLDCDDATREVRLRARGWRVEAIAEAIADGQELRQHIGYVIDTSEQNPDETAVEIIAWIAAIS